LWNVQHITQGDWGAKTRFEDDRANPYLVDCGLVPKAHTAFAWGVVFEIRPVWSDVVCGTTVHHPSYALSSIQGNTDVIDLLYEGGGRY
jgi:hypothetical protein